MQAVRLGVEIIEGRFVAIITLDATELVDDRTTHLVGRDHLEHLEGFVAEHVLGLRRKIDIGEVLGEASVIVDVALLDAAPVELLGNDRVGDA